MNVSSATADGWEPGGPWNAQAALLIRLTDARSEVATARRLADDYLPGHPEKDVLHLQAEGADAGWWTSSGPWCGPGRSASSCGPRGCGSPEPETPAQDAPTRPLTSIR